MADKRADVTGLAAVRTEQTEQAGTESAAACGGVGASVRRPAAKADGVRDHRRGHVTAAVVALADVAGAASALPASVGVRRAVQAVSVRRGRPMVVSSRRAACSVSGRGASRGGHEIAVKKLKTSPYTHTLTPLHSRPFFVEYRLIHPMDFQSRSEMSSQRGSFMFVCFPMDFYKV